MRRGARPYLTGRSAGHGLNGLSPGRSLVEFLVGVAVAAVVLTLATGLPASLGASARVETLSGEMLSATRFARSEAMTRGARVTLCPTADPQAAQPSCSPPNVAPAGWLVFVDEIGRVGNQPGVLERPGDTLLRVVRGDKAVGVTATHPDFHTWVAYDARGMLLGASGWIATDIVFCLSGSAGVVSLRASGSASMDRRRC